MKKSRFKAVNMQVSSEVRECKRQLDILYILKSKGMIIYRDLYKQKKTEYDRLLRDCKKNNIVNRLRSSDNKSKSAWLIVNEITGKSKSNNLKVDGDKLQVANEFNDFLINYIQDLIQALPNINFSTNISYNPD